LVTFGFTFTYNDYINPHFRPLKPHSRIWALEIERRSVRVKVWASVREVWGLKPNSRILLSNKIVKVSKTWKSLLKWIFDKLSCVKPIFHLFQVSRESGILGLKNENPCFENFSGVPSSWFRPGGGEESQGFPEVKKWKPKNGFLTMSSPNPKLSRTIFSFAIGWVEIKIFQFWDIELEVERSQLVVQKISKWFFSHHFFSPPRTHMNLWNQIWISITHSMIVRRFTNYKLEGRWRVTRK
jgi:hypothetical protein